MKKHECTKIIDVILLHKWTSKILRQLKPAKCAEFWVDVFILEKKFLEKNFKKKTEQYKRQILEKS